MVLMHLHIALVLRELAKFLGNGRVMSAVLALVLHTEYSGSGMQMRKLGKLWWIEASRLSTMPSLLPLPSLSVRSGGFTRGGGGLSFLCVPWGALQTLSFRRSRQKQGKRGDPFLLRVRSRFYVRSNNDGNACVRDSSQFGEAVGTQMKSFC